MTEKGSDFIASLPVLHMVHKSLLQLPSDSNTYILNYPTPFDEYCWKKSYMLDTFGSRTCFCNSAYRSIRMPKTTTPLSSLPPHSGSSTTHGTPYPPWSWGGSRRRVYSSKVTWLAGPGWWNVYQRQLSRHLWWVSGGPTPWQGRKP